MVSIAHRLSTIKKDDKIIVMHDEGVVGDENYSKLTAQIRLALFS